MSDSLSFDTATAHPLVASEHVHRYQLAARLCRDMRVLDLACGSGYGSAILGETAAAVTGIDEDAATIDAASAAIRGSGDVAFEAADVLAFLQGDLTSRFDAIVCLQGFERFGDRQAMLEGLARHAAAGLAVVVSIPFGYEEAVAAFARFDQPTTLYQFLAEGSLIRRENASDLAGEFVLREHGELEWAAHYIACVNLDARVRELPEWTGMRLAVAPQYNRLISQLECANRELWRENARLAREHLGTSAPTPGAPERAGDPDERALQLESRIRELEATLALPRHRAVERLRRRARERPVLDRLLRRVGRLVS